MSSRRSRSRSRNKSRSRSSGSSIGGMRCSGSRRSSLGGGGGE